MAKKSDETDLTTFSVMDTPVNELEPVQAAQAYLVLGATEKLVKDRKEAIRGRLLTEAEESGQESEKGHYVLDVDGNKVIREKRVGATYKIESVAALLDSKGIPIEDGTDEVKTLIPNPSKLKYLVDTGKLHASDLEGLQPVTWALKVEASPEFQKVLDEANKKTK